MGELKKGPLQPCSICGELTDLCCSDCRIDTGKNVYVCSKSDCGDKHELLVSCSPTTLDPNVESFKKLVANKLLINVTDVHVGVWYCNTSLIGHCMYNGHEDPSHNNCLFCHLPEKRFFPEELRGLGIKLDNPGGM